jgi:hypothetical protein
MKRDKLHKLAKAICECMGREDIDYEDITDALADALNDLAREDMPGDRPESINPPPPDDLPCWAWEEDTRPPWDEMDLVPGIAHTEYRHWWPCFVPLDAKPREVWVLYKDGCVSLVDSLDNLDRYDRGNCRYVFTVPEVDHETV